MENCQHTAKNLKNQGVKSNRASRRRTNLMFPGQQNFFQYTNLYPYVFLENGWENSVHKRGGLAEVPTAEKSYLLHWRRDIRNKSNKYYWKYIPNRKHE